MPKTFVRLDPDGIDVTFPAGFSTVTVLHRHWDQYGTKWVDCGGKTCQRCRDAERLHVHFHVPVESGLVPLWIEANYQLYRMLVATKPTPGVTVVRIRKIRDGMVTQYDVERMTRR